MLGIEVMPGRLDSSLRFIDIKLSVSRSLRLYSRSLLVRRTDRAAPDNPRPSPFRAGRPIIASKILVPYKNNSNREAQLEIPLASEMGFELLQARDSHRSGTVTVTAPQPTPQGKTVDDTERQLVHTLAHAIVFIVSICCL